MKKLSILVLVISMLFTMQNCTTQEFETQEETSNLEVLLRSNPNTESSNYGYYYVTVVFGERGQTVSNSTYNAVLEILANRGWTFVSRGNGMNPKDGKNDFSAEVYKRKRTSMIEGTPNAVGRIGGTLNDFPGVYCHP